MERARFVTNVDEKHIEVFLINQESNGWINSVKFEKYLRGNLEYLEKYKNLKEACSGLSVREYYRKKIKFINDILRI